MDESQMMHGQDWEGQDPTGWIASEKLDGCRAYWDGSKFWTRSGRIINAPDWFCEGLPNTPLDGEIWAGRGGFNAARNAVNFGKFTEQIRFAVFGFPQGEVLIASAHAFVVESWLIKSRSQMIRDLQRIQSAGGEGLMIRNPRVTWYEIGRTKNLLKVKRLLNSDWNALL